MFKFNTYYLLLQISSINQTEGKEMILFSIIMPVYNNEKYFPMAVESVERQNYDDYELIIIDDGSTDRTPHIADTLAAKNPHIRVIHQENQWIYNSFNKGISLANGQYIYILNSDDQLMPGTLELFARKIEEYHPDIIWTKVLQHVCDRNQNIIHYDKFNSEKKVMEECFYSDKRKVERAWPLFVLTGVAQNQANLYRSEIMKKQLFRNDVYGADTLYNIDIANHINSALILTQPAYAFFIYEDNHMNVSVGKYYPYEHEMFNEIYIRYKELFQQWNLMLSDYLDILSKKRMSGLSIELRSLQAGNCPFSLEEKLGYMFCGCIDNIIKECVSESNRQEELESRILSVARELLIKEPIEKNNKMYFAYELLDSLLRYEKEEEDYKRIENAINHPLNPFHIGKSFYDKLIQS